MSDRGQLARNVTRVTSEGRSETLVIGVGGGVVRIVELRSEVGEPVAVNKMLEKRSGKIFKVA